MNESWIAWNSDFKILAEIHQNKLYKIVKLQIGYKRNKIEYNETFKKNKHKNIIL